MTLEPQITGVVRLGYDEVNHPEWFELHAGCDESGKGDVFGPLISACVIADGDMADDDLETIIHKVAGDAAKAGVFNNAAQVWNHTFYWHSMKPNGGGKPTGAIASKIDEDFGSYDAFVEAFKAAGATQFGSGWAWLVLDNGKLKVEKTGNAELPMTKGQTAILTMDVWEHAYYLDFQNRRPDYIATFLNELVNWDFANENLAKA